MDINYSALSTLDINNFLSSDKNVALIFKGCYPADKLPDKFTLPAGFIVNTQTSKEKGEHWVSIYINKNRVCEYFDSYGFPPLISQHKMFIQTHSKKMIFNKQTLQSLYSSICGHYCCLFLGAKAREISLNSFVKSYFGNDCYSNDAHTILLFRRNFLIKGSCCKVKCNLELLFCKPKQQ